MFVDEYDICRPLQVLQDKVVVWHKFALGNELHPLNEDVDVPSLEENVVPLIRFDHVQNKAHVELLIFWRLVVLLDFTKHAYNREQGIFFEL